ncbi:recombinase family protein [Pelotomaculum terephthalicicum JT]|uniref:recombinase family protein n=1 Tax=Pelotomaculum terephthalicicum TaxID=206393 RepID=UPI001F04926F|nr:recombinase family protein [Pelotomaculum terephthalicicum]MCG9969218.1 recombinase family protein [Pelotomaculum terephthalicicum JT]
MIREDEAEVVRRIFASYLAGKGIDEIAAELTKDKVPKKDGGTKWYYRFHHRHRKHRSKGCKASVKE